MQVLRSLNENFDYFEEILEQRTDFENILLKSGLEKIFRNVLTGDDGNCFYRCIAKLLLGNESLFYIIKITSVFRVRLIGCQLASSNRVLQFSVKIGESI